MKRGTPHSPSRGGRAQWPVLCALHSAGLDWPEIARYTTPHAITVAQKRWHAGMRHGEAALRDAQQFVLDWQIDRKVKWEGSSDAR